MLCMIKNIHKINKKQYKHKYIFSIGVLDSLYGTDVTRGHWSTESHILFSLYDWKWSGKSFSFVLCLRRINSVWICCAPCVQVVFVDGNGLFHYRGEFSSSIVTCWWVASVIYVKWQPTRKARAALIPSVWLMLVKTTVHICLRELPVPFISEQIKV